MIASLAGPLLVFLGPEVVNVFGGGVVFQTSGSNCSKLSSPLTSRSSTSRRYAPLDCLKKLRREGPDDVVVNLSVAELISEAYPNNKRLAKQIVQLAGDVDNESTVHAALMLYKAQALRILGLNTAARDVLTPALRKAKGRDEDLLRAIRYERACVYEDLGRKSQARREFEKL